MQADFYFADRQSVFFSPRKVVLSVGASKTVGAEVKALGSKKSLIVTDPGVLKTGMVEAIRESILAEGIEVIVFDRVEMETPARVIDECAAFARKRNAIQSSASGEGRRSTPRRESPSWRSTEGRCSIAMAWSAYP